MITRRQQGMILLNTIIIIGLLGLFVLSQTQLVFLYYKAQNQVEAHHHALQQLEVAAYQCLASNNPPECIIPARDPNVVIEELKKPQQGCAITFNKQSYVFIIEDLGSFPCLQVHINEQLYSTKHLRLTIASRVKKPMMLQIRIAYAIPLLACKQLELGVIKLGVISWRYLA